MDTLADRIKTLDYLDSRAFLFLESTESTMTTKHLGITTQIERDALGLGFKTEFEHSLFLITLSKNDKSLCTPYFLSAKESATNKAHQRPIIRPSEYAVLSELARNFITPSDYTDNRSGLQKYCDELDEQLETVDDFKYAEEQFKAAMFNSRLLQSMYNQDEIEALLAL